MLSIASVNWHSALAGTPVKQGLVSLPSRSRLRSVAAAFAACCRGVTGVVII